MPHLLCVLGCHDSHVGQLLTEDKLYTCEFVFRRERLQVSALTDTGRIMDFEPYYFYTESTIIKMLHRSTHEVFTLSRRLPHGMLEIRNWEGSSYAIAESDVSSFYIRKDGVICERSFPPVRRCEGCKQMKLSL